MLLTRQFFLLYSLILSVTASAATELGQNGELDNWCVRGNPFLKDQVEANIRAAEADLRYAQHVCPPPCPYEDRRDLAIEKKAPASSPDKK